MLEVMSEQPLLSGLAAGDLSPRQEPRAAEADRTQRKLRLDRPDRAQSQLVAQTVDEWVPPDHQVRVIWALVERLDVSPFAARLKAYEGEAGRAATDPRLLVALWLWAATQGVGSAREVSRLCQCHDAYRWLCGGVPVNYHTLSDFRVAHESALDGLFTELLAVMMARGLVSVKRVSQDGVRVRASAGRGSFHGRPTLERSLEEARAQLASLKAQREAPAQEASATARQRAARERAARERGVRVSSALEALASLERVKARHNGKSSGAAARSSTTDAESRVMKMPDGGFRPAYNVQLASDVSSRAIVGVDVTNSGSDKAQSEPMRDQVQRRTGAKVSEHLMDGGYVRLEDVERAERSGTAVYAPPQASQNGGPSCAVRGTDSPEVASWRQRMASLEGQAVYRQRAATSETIHGDLRCYRGLGPLVVRGLSKVRCVALWSALAYNVLHFGRMLVT